MPCFKISKVYDEVEDSTSPDQLAPQSLQVNTDKIIGISSNSDSDQVKISQNLY